jgi:hypothetical protein
MYYNMDLRNVTHMKKWRVNIIHLIFISLNSNCKKKHVYRGKIALLPLNGPKKPGMNNNTFILRSSPKIVNFPYIRNKIN